MIKIFMDMWRGRALAEAYKIIKRQNKSLAQYENGLARITKLYDDQASQLKDITETLKQAHNTGEVELYGKRFIAVEEIYTDKSKVH